MAGWYLDGRETTSGVPAKLRDLGWLHFCDAIVVDPGGLEYYFQFQRAGRRSAEPVRSFVLVCLCHPTSDAEIETHVETGARSIEEIARRCGAGTGCGACVCQIEEILDEIVPQGAACASEPRGARQMAAKSAGVDCSRRPVPLRSRPTSSREAA
jgi:bacterioferritin-associated ferredoxin